MNKKEQITETWTYTREQITRHTSIGGGTVTLWVVRDEYGQIIASDHQSARRAKAKAGKRAQDRGIPISFKEVLNGIA